MANLKDIIIANLNELLLKGDKWYFGELTEYSETQKPNDVAVLLDIESVHSGYLIIRSEADFYEVSHVADDETYHFLVYPSKMNLILEQPQLTKNEPILRQAITKSDWIRQHPIIVAQEGDYNEHRAIMKKALEEFRAKGHSALLLWPLIK